MKILFAIITIAFLLTNHCLSQNAYYDALLMFEIQKDMTALLDAKAKMTQGKLDSLNKANLDKEMINIKEKIKQDNKIYLDTILGSESKETFITTKYLEYLKTLPNSKLEVKLITFDVLSDEENSMIDFLKEYTHKPFLPTNTVLKYKDNLRKNIDGVYKKIENYNVVVELIDKINTNKKNSKKIKVDFEKVDVNLSKNDSKLDININSSNVTASSTVSNNFYDALATFLVERFKEELVLEVIDKVKDYLRKNDVLFKLLIPKTYDLIQAEDFAQYVTIKHLKSSLEEDFNDFPVNGRDFITKNKYNASVPELDYLSLGISIWEDLKKGEHPLKVIMNNKENIFTAFNFRDEIYTKVIQGLDKNFRDASDDKNEIKWISPDVFANIESEEENYLICIFLDYSDLSSLKEKFRANDPKIKNIISAYKDYLKVLEIIKSTIDNFKAIDKTSSEKLHLYIDNSFDLFLKSMNVLNKLNDATLVKTEELKEHYGYIKDIYKAVVKKNYSYAAILFANKYLTYALGEYFESGKDEEDENLNAESVKTIMRYIGFVSDIASAQSGDEMKTAIEDFALQPLSIKIKRKADFDISLIGSPGLMIGREFNFADNMMQHNGIYGISVPIGLDFSWGNTGDTCDIIDDALLISEGNSIGFTLTILDLAAIFKYRFNENSAEIKDIDKLTFENLFSPGIIIKYGFPNSPVSLGFGLLFTPKLREITNGVATIKTNSLTFGVHLSWDIALVNLSRTQF